MRSASTWTCIRTATGWTAAAPVLLCLVLTGCASAPPPQPQQTVEAIGKVVDNLATETIKRQGADPFKGLPLVVRSVNNSNAETALAELMRTRLVERGVTVEVACQARCLEMSLLEFSLDTPATAGLTPGQVLSVAGGAVPVLGGLTRTLQERERDARAGTRGVLVTYSAREANRYVARQHVVAVLATSSEVQ
jgi:hypothetical protein